MVLRLASSAMRRPVPWMAGVALLTVFFALGLPRLQIRTSGEAMHPDRSEVFRRTDEDRLIFPDPDELMLIVSSRTGGAPLASPDGLRALKDIHVQLGNLPGVQRGGVRSLASLPLPPGADQVLRSRTFLDSIPEEPSRLAALMRTIEEHPLASGLFLSSDGRAAVFYIPLETGANAARVIRNLEEWIRARSRSGLDLRLLGPLVAETTLGGMILGDLVRLVPLMVLMIALMLFFFLGTRAGVLIPLTESLLVLIWTLGAMAWCRVPLTLVTTILPVVLMAMAITDEIHLVEKVQRALGRFTAGSEAAAERPAADRVRLRASLDAGLQAVGPPIVATTLCTALGFVSFLSASMSPMRQFGLFAALGILFAMALSFTFVPAAAVLLPVSWFRPRGSLARRRLENLLLSWEHTITGVRKRAWLAPALLLAVGLPGVLRLTVQDAWVDNFSPRSSLVRAEEEFNRRFWGSYCFDVVFQAAPGFFLQPSGAAMIQGCSVLAHAGSEVGGVLSYLVPVRQVYQALGGRDDPSVLPPEKLVELTTVAQVWAGAGEMDRLLTPDGSSARVRIFLPRANYKRTVALQKHLEAGLPGLVQGTEVQVHFSGDLPVAVEVVQAIVTNQLRSIGVDILSMAILFLLVLRPRRGALVVLVPILAADWVIFAGMGYFGVPLGIATSMFAAMTLGVGVDYSLHLYYNYRRHRQANLDHDTAWRTAMEDTGQAIRWNALALTAWFLVLTVSAFRPNRALGLLLSSAMLTCYGTTLLLLPGLLRRLPLAGVLLGLILPVGASSARAAEGRSTQVAQVQAERPRGDISRQAQVMGLRADVSPQAQAKPPPGEVSRRLRGSAPVQLHAEELLRRLEDDFQRSPRVVKMDIQTEYQKRGVIRRTLWGAFDCDSEAEHEALRVLFVYGMPQTERGMTLLMNLTVEADRPDSFWLYLPSLRVLRRLDENNQSLAIPGTGLSYGDARGYLPVRLYNFGAVRLIRGADGSDTLTTKAYPKTREIGRSLGYDSLKVDLDPEKMCILRIDYAGRNRALLKRYSVEESTELRGVWLPRSVRITHPAEGSVSRMEFSYWPMRERPAASFYGAVQEPSFLERMGEFLQRQGIDPGWGSP